MIICNYSHTFDAKLTDDEIYLLYIGINDEQRVVRNAALFAVGQFSEHLQVSSAPFGWLPGQRRKQV